MASMPDSQPNTSQSLHRREITTQIILPLVGGSLFILLLFVGALLLQRRLQVSLVSDLMMTCLVLCPAVICLFPLYVVMMVMAFAMGKVSDAVAKPLYRMENWSKSLAHTATNVTDTINHKTIDLSAKLAPVEKILSAFDQPQNIQEENHDTDTL